ncbi:MAG: dihydroorotase [Brevinema sp.]
MILFKNALLSNNTMHDFIVQKGQITALDQKLNIAVNQTIDCEGRLLLSGMIDVHVHFRDPGFPQKEDATSGTKAALRGGVTSIIDMPNTNPLCTTVETLIHKKDIYRQQAYCHYGFHFGGDSRDNSRNLPHPSQYAALKIFLNESTGNMLVTDESVLNNLFKNSRYIAVHAEGDAIDKAIYFAKKYNNILYLCHISQYEELQLIKQVKQNKMSIFAEVCPHHVLFNSSQETDLLTMKPRLRSLRDQEALLEALDSGVIDTWGTDHAPHLITEKKIQLTYGIPSIEFSLEILLTLAKKMHWSYDKVEALYSRHPQQIFQIKQKGQIAIGYDADFVLIDQDQSYLIQEKDVVSRCGWSPYIGYQAKSKIHSTYIGGEQVYNRAQQSFEKSSYIKELSYDR